jgi:Na+-translocating ferredoxin:NAD+ oxidoreductase RNF subunit RnfB
VLTADNVQKRIGFMCHCCLLPCFRSASTGIPTRCHLHYVVTDENAGCEKCAQACPITPL